MDSSLGTLLVLPNVYWRRTRGHLWWRDWGSPTVTAELFSVVGDDADDGFYYAGPLEALVRQWDGGRWIEPRVDLSTEWLDDDTSAQIARGVFGVDLARERNARGANVTHG